MLKLIILSFIFSSLLQAETSRNGKFIPEGEEFAKSCELIHELQKPNSQIILSRSVFNDPVNKKEIQDHLILICKDCNKKKADQILTTKPSLQPSKWSYVSTTDTVSTNIQLKSLQKQKINTQCFADSANKNVSLLNDQACAKKIIFNHLTDSLPMYQKVDLIKNKDLSFIDFFQICRIHTLRLEVDNFITEKWKNFQSRRNYPEIHKQIEMNDSERVLSKKEAPAALPVANTNSKTARPR